MKKILLIVPVLFLTGCGAEPIDGEDTNNFTYYIQDSLYYDFYIDKETCVEYIKEITHDSLTPRLNSDGTLKLNEICIENKE